MSHWDDRDDRTPEQIERDRLEYERQVKLREEGWEGPFTMERAYYYSSAKYWTCPGEKSLILDGDIDKHKAWHKRVDQVIALGTRLA